jgi:transposase
MRGVERVRGVRFATVVLEDQVPADHPLRAIPRLVDQILRDPYSGFQALYSQTGCPSLPPDQLLRAMLQKLLNSIRSDRQQVEQHEHHLHFR